MTVNDCVTSSKSQDAVLTAACCVALATLVPVSLYQTSHLQTLPDPPASVFDSEEIVSSRMAHPFGVPDGLLGLVSFGTTFALILLAKRHPVARTMLGAKLALDGAVATFNAGRQVVGFGKLCSWCTGTAIAVGVMTYAGKDIIAETWSTVSTVFEEQR